VGGTGLYVRALIDDPRYPPVAPQLGFREAMADRPLDELVRMLLRIDPAAEGQVDLKNPRRVLRALEVATFTGKPFTSQRIMGTPRVEALQIAQEWPREELYSRIDGTVDEMLARGWLDEVRGLLADGLPPDGPAMQSIGYRELASALNGKTTIEAAVMATKRAVRQYAKRQLTWFRRDVRVTWVASEDEGVAAAEQWLGGRG
jgi:tRNA dimethylallyltransferase